MKVGKIMEENLTKLLDKIAENPQDLESIAQAKQLAGKLNEKVISQETKVNELSEQNRKLFLMIPSPETKHDQEDKTNINQVKMTFEDLINKE